MNRQWGKVMMMVAVGALVATAVGCQQVAQTRPSRAKAVSSLQRIHFDFDRSAVKTEYRSVLKGNAEWMKKHSSSNVVIEGHCDERGSTEYNIALGWRRARSAKNYMTSLGIGAGRMSTKSYGEERPLCRQSDESCWWKNRRGEFLKR